MTSAETDSKLSQVLARLKIQIDGLHMIFETVRDIILELARFLDENKYCETSEICSLIKKLLADKIKETKITARWIEECLPKKYKRKYDKSELASHSVTETNPKSASQYAVQLKQALLKKAFENTLDQEHKFEVNKEKLVEIVDLLENCKERCFLIFNHGALIRIETDNMGGNEYEQ